MADSGKRYNDQYGMMSMGRIRLSIKWFVAVSCPGSLSKLKLSLIFLKSQ